MRQRTEIPYRDGPRGLSTLHRKPRWLACQKHHWCRSSIVITSIFGTLRIRSITSFIELHFRPRILPEPYRSRHHHHRQRSTIRGRRARPDSQYDTSRHSCQRRRQSARGDRELFYRRTKQPEHASRLRPRCRALLSMGRRAQAGTTATQTLHHRYLYKGIGAEARSSVREAAFGSDPRIP